MEKKDIPTNRSLIGYQRSSFGSKRPAVVLDASTLWAERSNSLGLHVFERSKDNRYSSNSSWSSSYTIGYLALIVHDSDYAEGRRTAALEALADLLTKIPASADLTSDYVKTLANNLPEGLTLDIVNNRYLYGPTWAAVEAAEKAKRAAQAKADDEERRKRKAHHGRVEQIRAHVEEAELQEWQIVNEGNGRVSIPSSMLVKLLGIKTESPS